jgi:hypothetical protein
MRDNFAGTSFSAGLIDSAIPNFFRNRRFTPRVAENRKPYFRRNLRARFS